LVEGNAEGFPADRTPSETFLKISTSITTEAIQLTCHRLFQRPS
jgi:hypothetical protein